MKLTTLFISTTRNIYTKLWNFLLILFMLAVICKQRFLHGNEIVQYFRNCICYGIGQDHFRKSLYSLYKVHEKGQP